MTYHLSLRTQLAMPMAEWACYATQLAPLEAERSLRDAEAAALPWMGSADRRRAVGRLHRLAFADLDAAAPLPIDGLALRHQAAQPSRKGHR